MRESRANGVAVTVVLFPCFADMPGYTVGPGHELVRDLFREAGAEVIDLPNLFGGLDPRDLRVSPQDAHPNETAHRMAAEAIARHLFDQRPSRDARRSDDEGYRAS